MSQETNHLIVSGRLTADCELSDDKKMANFTVANSNVYKKKDHEELTTDTTFIPFTYWNPNNVVSHLKKGTSVVVEARVRNNNWESNGVKHYSFKFEVVNITLVGSPKNADS